MTEQILKLRKEGLGYKKIASLLNVSHNHVRYVCLKNNLGGTIGESVPKLTDSEIRERVEETTQGRFEYGYGYVNNQKKLVLICKSCGFEKEIYWSSLLSKRHSIRCDCCYEMELSIARSIKWFESEINRFNSYLERNEKENESIAKEELRYYSSKKVCDCCGKIFFGNVNQKRCSSICSNRMANKQREYTRDKRIVSQEHDTDIVLAKLAIRDKDVCYLCGETVDWSDCQTINGTFVAGNRYPSVDHVIPLAKHGTHTWDNVRLAHRICNTNKSDKIIPPSKF